MLRPERGDYHSYENREVRNMGMFNPMYILGAVLLVLAPVILGMIVLNLLSGMHILVYYVIGYVLLILADLFIVAGVMKIPGTFAVLASLILPWLQFALGASLAAAV